MNELLFWKLFSLTVVLLLWGTYYIGKKWMDLAVALNEQIREAVPLLEGIIELEKVMRRDAPVQSPQQHVLH